MAIFGTLCFVFAALLFGRTIFRMSPGDGCASLLDETMRDLPCTRLELDELWAFVGKKQRHVKMRWTGCGRERPEAWTWTPSVPRWDGQDGCVCDSSQ
jgi:hypothetical protein